MKIVRNQYITYHGISPEYISRLHKVTSSPEMRENMPWGTTGRAVTLNAVKYDRDNELYTVELMCPLEYAEGESSFRLDGKALSLVHEAMGELYPRNEVVGPDVQESVEQVIKITGVTPEQISSVFRMCSYTHSNYRVRIAGEHQLSSEVVKIAQLAEAEWKKEFQTFTVTVRLAAKQYFPNSAKRLLLWESYNGWKEQSGTLCASRNVLCDLYTALNAYWSFRREDLYDD